MPAKKIRYKGATYIRADKQAVEDGLTFLADDFQAVFNAKMELYSSLTSLARVFKEMGPSYEQFADELTVLRGDGAGGAYSDNTKKLRSIKQRAEEQLGKDLGGKFIINW